VTTLSQRLRVMSLVGSTVVLMFAGSSTGFAEDADNELKITTIPAVAGFPVQLDDQTVMTDFAGVATFTVADAKQLANSGDLASRVIRVVPARVVSWSGQPQITLDFFWKVDFSFVTANSAPIDIKKVGKITLKNSIGEEKEVAPQEAVWLQGSRVVPLLGHLEDKKIYWTVQSVPYEGSNVVNASQQRLLPADQQSFPITLLFYSARVRAHDAFFGWGTGSSLRLTFPDSHVVEYPMDGSRQVLLPSLVLTSPARLPSRRIRTSIWSSTAGSTSARS
jgi:hypothetical protein